MKLSPKKCAFGMREGTFLGYKVNTDGLRVSSDKVKAVLDLPYPKCLKDVQKINGKLACLNRFLSKSTEKSLPFFKTLKKCTKKSDFQWTPKAEGAFKEMKQSIMELSMLTAPKEKEELIMYLAVAKEAISAVLMTERDGKQVPVYFVSHALQGPEINYTPMEKKILALVSANGSSCVDGSRAGLIIMNPKGMEFIYALRGENKEADALSKITSTSFAHLSKQVLVEELKEKAIDEKEILVAVEEEGHTWMTLVYEYLTEGILPEKKRKEIHEGSCSMHVGPRSMVAKALRSGYFWPTMHTDARNLIRECKDCQVHRLMPRNPQEKLTPITSLWPFNKWGIDIAEPFLEGPGKEKREQATIQEARNKAKMEGYYNARVQSTSFRLGDFVYQSNEASHAEDGGKLEPKWEGPYEVTEALGKGAYRLRDRNGHTLSRTCNICTLKSATCMKCKHPFARKAKKKRHCWNSLCL
nr:reverse transcriptase domain-containing protein [Tanacetum cinerariifolium]